jgi:phosphoribosylaminoimidazolecarboxamide formyltransferase/IMP cyclohydrolase
MPRALLSVSDKTGLVDFARQLVGLGWELISTGGTARALREAGLGVADVSDVTRFPEMLDGRVKTLHPAVHGGLLARRDLPEHMAAIGEHDIAPIDWWWSTSTRSARRSHARASHPRRRSSRSTSAAPSMLRSAAKNFGSVTVVVDPADYTDVLAVLAGTGRRRGVRAAPPAGRQGVRAHRRLRRGDRRLVRGAGGGPLPGSARAGLRARAAAALRREPRPARRLLRRGQGPRARCAGAEGRQGALVQQPARPRGALLAAEPFAAGDAGACCAIIKHTTPCGLAVGGTAREAYEKALACDPTSAFGSVIAFTVPVDDAAAEQIAKLFVECIVAPSFSEHAVEVLGRKKNLRILEGSATPDLRALDYKRVRGGLLVQDRQPPATDEHWTVVSARQPTPAELADLRFAWRAVRSVKSNAIVLARGGMTLGIGAGQMSRVDSSFLAAHKARQAGHALDGVVLGSDAFFPFRDGIDQAAEAGVRAIVQPGGSVRDAEVVAAVDERGMAMVFTGQRLFRH